MTDSRFSGLGLARYEGELSIENGDTVLFGQIHSLGTAMQLGPVAFGDPKIDTVDVGVNGTAHLLALDEQLFFAGALQLHAVNGLAAELSDRCKLFSFASSTGHFTTIDASGLALNTSRLYTDDTIRVTAVPETGTWALTLSGLGVVGEALCRRSGPAA